MNTQEIERQTIKLELDTINIRLARIDNPRNRYEIVQVALFKTMQTHFEEKLKKLETTDNNANRAA